MNLTPLRLQLWLDDKADTIEHTDIRALREAFIEGQKTFGSDDFGLPEQKPTGVVFTQFTRAIFEEWLASKAKLRAERKSIPLQAEYLKLERASLELHLRVLETVLAWAPPTMGETREMMRLLQLLAKNFNSDSYRHYENALDAILAMLKKHGHPGVDSITEQAERLADPE